MSSYRSLLAVDPSLTCSGWALLSIADGSISAVGKVKSEPPSVGMAERLRLLQGRIEGLLDRLKLSSQDVMVCEAPTTVKDPHNALKVEHVRSLFEAAARSRSLSVPGRVNPRTVQFEVMGMHGKQLERKEVKAMAVRTATFLYASELQRLGIQLDDLQKHQDIVDALLLGRVALTRIQSAHNAGLPLADIFQGEVTQRRTSWRVKVSGA
jgi:Holliday junction resolvasome RuvABC endonuclease subunit